MMINLGHTHDVYHTSESEIGVWIDGKPIYRKVVPFTIATYSTAIQTGVSNMGQVVRMDGLYLDADGYRTVPWAYGYGASTDAVWYIGAICNPSNGVVTLMSGSQNYGKTGYLILEYTKTTD